MRKDGVDLSDNWTPLEYQQQTIKRGKNRAKYHVDRKQFTMIESEAITIHKSQGQTFQTIAVDITEPMSRALLYVALSRVTKLNGLYLYGNKTILTASIQAKSREQRKKKVEQDIEKESAHIEMRRLRSEALLENMFPFLDYELSQSTSSSQSKDYDLGIMFQNIQSFNANKEKISRDFGYQQADIILLVECHNRANLIHEADRLLSNQGYEMINFTYGTELNASNGQICYVRKGDHANNLNFVAHTANRDGIYTESKQNRITEISLFEYVISREKKLFIISVYKHAKCDKDTFFNTLESFLDKHFPNRKNDKDLNIFIVGDFNLDFNKRDNRNIYIAMRDELMLKILHKNEITYRNISHIDWAFKNTYFNLNSIHSLVYDTWFSDHSAIWTEIKF